MMSSVNTCACGLFACYCFACVCVCACGRFGVHAFFLVSFRPSVRACGMCAFELSCVTFVSGSQVFSLLRAFVVALLRACMRSDVHRCVCRLASLFLFLIDLYFCCFSIVCLCFDAFID